MTRLTLIALLMLTTAVQAAPSYRLIRPSGLQPGKPTVVTVFGENLLPEPKLLLNAPIVKQEVVGKPTARQVQIKITLDKEAKPGLYNVRLATQQGITEAFLMPLDHLPTVTGNEVEALPTAISGEISGSSLVRTTFPGKKGQRIVIEVEAKRLGSDLSPVLHLYDPTRREVTWAYPTPTLGGDARLQATLPAEGSYEVTIHDQQYKAGGQSRYRLKLGTFHHADMVFPPAVQRGKATALRLLGNVPATLRVKFTANGTASYAPVPWPKSLKPSGLRPRVLVSDFPELVEQARTNGEPQVLPAAPVAVSGRLDVAGQEDVYRIQVKEGDKLRFEIFADRLGSPIDSLLTLRNPGGRTLASNDDVAGTPDSRLDYVVPKGVKTLVVAVADRLEKGGERSIYRLALTSSSQGTGKGFRLRLPANSYSIPQGKRRVVAVEAERLGYDGPIRLTCKGLPPGIEMSVVEIPAKTAGALVTLTGTGKQVGHDFIEIRGETVGITPPLVRLATFDKHPLAESAPWLQEDVAVALATAPKEQFAIDWKDSTDDKLILGETFIAGVKLTRSSDAKGTVRISLVTSQFPPLVRGRSDPKRTIRGQRPTVTLPVRPGRKPTNEANYNVLVPVNVAVHVCDLAFHAELLARDNRTVIAEAFTPVRRFVVFNRLQMKLVGGPNYQVAVDGKKVATVSIAGKIDRKAGFAGPATLTITGQPRGIAAPRMVLKPNMSDFVLSLKVPGNFAAGDYKDLKVTASGPADPKNARVVVRTEIPFTLKIVRVKQ